MAAGHLGRRVRRSQGHAREDFSDVALLVPNFVSAATTAISQLIDARISSNQYGSPMNPPSRCMSMAYFRGEPPRKRGERDIRRGPRRSGQRAQASLFGHSAIGGAINSSGISPLTSSRSHTTLICERDRIVARGVLNLPITDHLRSTQWDSENQHGYIRNLNGGTLERWT